MGDFAVTPVGVLTLTDLVAIITAILVLVFVAGLIAGFLSLLAKIGSFATSKVCPACRERVNGHAVKCKHCHERLAA